MLDEIKNVSADSQGLKCLRCFEKSDQKVNLIINNDFQEN